MADSAFQTVKVSFKEAQQTAEAVSPPSCHCKDGDHGCHIDSHFTSSQKFCSDYRRIHRNPLVRNMATADTPQRGVVLVRPTGPPTTLSGLFFCFLFFLSKTKLYWCADIVKLFS